MSEQFNPLEAASILRAEARSRVGPRLTRTDQMNAFALLKTGVKHAIVARIFGLSMSSVSQLANCLNHAIGRAWHYTDVFSEWQRLGEEDFIKAYLTEEHFLRAKRLKYGVDDNAIDDKLDLHLASNPRADSCSYGLIRSVTLGEEWRVRIDFAPCDPEIPEELRGPDGWRYASVNADDYPSGPYVSKAPYDEPVREDGLWMPWRTSAECFDHLHHIAGLRSPRRGRPRKTGK